MKKDKGNTKECLLKQLEEQKEDYEIILGEQKNVILRLKEDMRKMSAELEAYKNRDNLIGLTLKSAEEKAEETRRLCETEYLAEMRRLKEFKERWNKYFRYIKEHYPSAPEREAGENLLNKLGAVLLKNASDKERIGELNLAVSTVPVEFDPKSKVEAYLDGRSSEEVLSAFDMSEVLNPGELDLEELCKEMGLMEE